MNITTATTTTVIIELTEAEARTALAEPEALQHSLRAALAPIGAERARRDGRAKRFAPKAKAAGGRVVGRPEKKACPKCGKLMDPRGLAKHLPTCQGKDSA